MRNIEITTQNTSELTSVNDVKGYLEIDTDDSTYDDLLDRLVSAGSEFIKNETSRELVETTWKETIDGDGDTRLDLTEYPVQSVDNIKIDDETVYENDESQDSTDYYIYEDTGYIVRDIGWPEDYLNIEVNYTAGYSTIPEDLEQAAIDMVVFKFKNKDYVGLESHSLGDEDLTFNRKDVPEEILEVIDLYERRNI